jgi:hypothetical protein
MKKRIVVVSLGLAAALWACAVTRHGTLARIPGGPAMPVEVSVKADSAELRAVHPETGEVFEGILREDRGASRPGAASRVTPDFGSSASPGGPPDSAPPPASQAAVIDLAGTLHGDQGTTLICELQVERRIRLRGSGFCRERGAPEDAPFYRISF